MHWVLLAIIGLLVAALGIVSYSVAKNKTHAHADDGLPMSVRFRRILVCYLLLVGCCLVYLLISLSSVDFPETTLLPDPAPVENMSSAMVQDGPAQNQGQVLGSAVDSTIPILLKVFPQSTIGSAPTVSLALYGENFQPASKIRFNTLERAKTSLGTNLIVAPLEPADLVGMGSIMVDIVNPGNKASNVIAVPVRKPRVPLNVFGWHPLITREAQLLLIVVCAGALGSYVHAIKSLADFIGNQTLTASWFWWYITRPFLGMAMALIFYAVLRGGFLAGTPADAKVVNPFGMVAVGIGGS
jgi:hypothetical protein